MELGFESVATTWVYVGIALIMLGSCEIGYQLGNRARSRQDRQAPTSLGPMVAGLLGLLAFVLTFTFSMAAAEHVQRKQNVLDEANDVGTAYLRADLLDEPVRAEVQGLLRDYVDVRLGAAAGADIDAAIAKSVEIHGQLWAAVSAAARAAPSPNTSLMIQSINAVIDMHEKRITSALYNRIPNSVWLALLVISTLTMITMGTQIGFTGKRRLVAVIPLSLAFAVLVTLVVDLDRPQQGLITVGQHAMVDLQRTMGGPAPAK